MASGFSICSHLVNKFIIAYMSISESYDALNSHVADYFLYYLDIFSSQTISDVDLRAFGCSVTWATNETNLLVINLRDRTCIPETTKATSVLLEALSSILLPCFTNQDCCSCRRHFDLLWFAKRHFCRADNLLNKIPVLNWEALALGVWTAQQSNDWCPSIMKAFCSQERQDRGNRQGCGGHRRDLLHLASNITPPGNKQGLHENLLWG